MKKATLQTDGSWKIEEFTSEEVTDYNATVTSGQAIKQAHADAITKKATDQAAATTKLKALGLTDDEIVALIN